MRAPIPVTLVTGFLGAGKTTLLNHVLNSLGEGGGERRVVVIENEFGDVDVDGGLVDSAADALFALTEGCVCCTVRDDLVQVFERIREPRDRVDHVIVEASGLADPAPVLRVLERLGPSFRADGVVTVVDAFHAAADLDEHHTAVEQVAYADRIVLNKVDLPSTSALDALQDLLLSHNPLASIVRAQDGRVDVAQILDLGGHDPSLAPPHHDHHHHDDGIGSVAIQVRADIDLARLDLWLGSVLRRRDSTVLRMKGSLAVHGIQSRFIFHAVHEVVDVRPGRDWGDEERSTQIVLIGRGLDAEDLQQGLEGCVA